MSKIGHYLQEHLVGEVMTAAEARNYFSTDGSIFTIPPAVIVYPKNENDIRKTTRFTWQLAERGRVIPVTPRGLGSDQTGAALGSGIILVFPAHLNHILELEPKSGNITVEPGINYGKVQEALKTHGYFLPPYPAGLEYSTVGGAVANNVSGEKSVKYGETLEFVKGLRVVLANGEVIETRRLNKRELSKKLGLATFEGEIYRAIDTLLEEQKELVEASRFNLTKNAAGYNLAAVKRKDGSFDLTTLFTGSQGTLGIISEITLTTKPYNPETVLIMASFDNLQALQNAVLELRQLSDVPSAMEMVDANLLKYIYEHNPNHLKGVIDKPFPEAILLAEFDDSDRHQKKAFKKAQKVLEKYASYQTAESTPSAQEQLRKVRRASAMVVGQAQDYQKAVPVIGGAAVAPDRLAEYIEGVRAMLVHNHLSAAIWGSAGDGILYAKPFLNLGQVGDRQKIFRLMDEYYKLVISLGGSVSGDSGEGRLKAPYVEHMYGPEIYGLFQRVKQIFDPYGTLNPGVKINVSLDDIKPLLRQDYGLGHLYNHLPHN